MPNPRRTAVCRHFAFLHHGPNFKRLEVDPSSICIHLAREKFSAKSQPFAGFLESLQAFKKSKYLTYWESVFLS